VGPLFILGFPRSGTTAMARALSDLKRFGTYEREGHFLYIMTAGIARIQRGEFNENSVLRAPGAPERFLRGFTRTVNRLYSTTGNARDTAWIDKTPDIAQVRAVPVIDKLWPEARYVFLYRPPLAAVRSSLALWHDRVEGREVPTAERWAACQRAWRAARAELGTRFVEVYQPLMLSDPHVVAGTLGPLLSLSEEEVAALAQTWERDRAVNRPRGERGKAYDAVTIAPDVAREIRRVTAAEVAKWPRLAAADAAGEDESDG